jgi:hypothetical protein
MWRRCSLLLALPLIAVGAPDAASVRASSPGAVTAYLAHIAATHRTTVAPAAPRHLVQPSQGPEFAGLGSTEQYGSVFYSYTPGEPVLAVGPSDVVETVNEAAGVFDKNGNKLAEIDFGTFWGGTISQPTQCTDPRALYIATVDRFAISCSDTSGGAAEPMRFAISATGDPTGSWFRYAAPNTGFLDQDKIEATSDKFVVAGNTSSSEVMYVYNLADVVGHASSPHVVKVTAKRSNVYEAAVQQTSTAPAYFVSSFPNNALYLATITGTPAATNVHLSEVHVPAADFAAPHDPQVPGGTFDGGDGRVLDAVFEVETSDSKPVIQYSSTRSCGARDCLTSARIDLSATKPVLVSDALVGAPGWDYTYGAVGLDAAGNVFEAYTRSSPGTGAGASVLGSGFDVDLQSPTTGTSVCDTHGTPPCFERWGDYLGTALDPSDPTSVWVSGLYQASSGPFGWETVIARVATTTYSLAAAITGGAGALKATSAKVSGTVNPHGAATTYQFEYGLTSGYDSATPAVSAGSGTSPEGVFANLTGLQEGTLYHYRLVATTAAGRAIGADRTFKTKGPKITSVVFTGSPAAPTVTVTGKNLGTEPAGSPAGCNDSGQDFGTALFFSEVTQQWTAGQSGDCIGLVVSSYTATRIVFTFGSNYNNFGPVTAGDGYSVTGNGATRSGTVAYTS